MTANIQNEDDHILLFVKIPNDTNVAGDATAPTNPVVFGLHLVRFQRWIMGILSQQFERFDNPLFQSLIFSCEFTITFVKSRIKFELAHLIVA